MIGFRYSRTRGAYVLRGVGRRIGPVLEVVRVHDLADDGWTHADLAEAFGISAQHVGRLFRREQRPAIAGLDSDAVNSSVAAAVDAFLADAELRSADEVLAETARALAAKLDGCRASDAAPTQAAPQIAARLVDVLERLRRRVPREPDRLDLIKQRHAARMLALAAANGHDVPGERVKTDARDARKLARLHAGGLHERSTCRPSNPAADARRVAAVVLREGTISREVCRAATGLSRSQFHAAVGYAERSEWLVSTQRGLTPGAVVPDGMLPTDTRAAMLTRWVRGRGKVTRQEAAAAIGFESVDGASPAAVGLATERGEVETAAGRALTPDAAAESLSMSRDHFDKHVKPDLRVVTKGHRILVPVRELERWMEDNAARALRGR